MAKEHKSLILSEGASRTERLVSLLGQGFLFVITSLSAIAVLLIFYFIARDAIPFFQSRGLAEFFTTTDWYPSREPPAFGTLSIIVGSALVTFGAILLAVPLGIAAAICLSDLLPFSVRQIVKPFIEILAAIPSVAYGFFALVVFAPILQEKGGHLLAQATWILGLPVLLLASIILGDLATDRVPASVRTISRFSAITLLACLAVCTLYVLARHFGSIQIDSGTNALNVSVLLGIMALPTVVSVSEDALQSVGRELREGSYALGATRAETIIRTIIPAAMSGICAAIILGVMRAIGETMVVWMASGNSARIPEPWYNFLSPVRTLTATIAGDMGEADQTLGSDRYHVLFAMALSLLVFSFFMNIVSEWVVARSRRKIGK